MTNLINEGFKMAKNTIWVTGASGRLGSALVALLKEDIC